MRLLLCEREGLKRFSKGAVHQTIYFPEAKAFHMAVPPIEEQRRIVAKVGALMVWCDQMEQGIATRDARRTITRETRRSRRSRARPHHAMRGSAPESNWSTLVQSADDVPTLRRLVLELAVRGRLVAQNPSDEAASSAPRASPKSARSW